MTTTIREGIVFGLMTPEERKALRDAEAVEVYSGSGVDWYPHSSKYLFVPHLAYRIAPAPVEPFRVDPIVWRVLDPNIRWITADKSRPGIYAHTSKPQVSGVFWGSYLRHFLTTHVIAPGLIQRGTCPWEEAIAERPEGM